jgi:hypothetical protein
VATVSEINPSSSPDLSKKTASRIRAFFREVVVSFGRHSELELMLSSGNSHAVTSRSASEAKR